MHELEEMLHELCMNCTSRRHPAHSIPIPSRGWQISGGGGAVRGLLRHMRHAEVLLPRLRGRHDPHLNGHPPHGVLHRVYGPVWPIQLA